MSFSLSELKELKKPTSDNPEILRFFKYMRAAKDGQDGIDCNSAQIFKCVLFLSEIFFIFRRAFLQTMFHV
jgi:hypothetical protein